MKARPIHVNVNNPARRHEEDGLHSRLAQRFAERADHADPERAGHVSSAGKSTPQMIARNTTGVNNALRPLPGSGPRSREPSAIASRLTLVPTKRAPLRTPAPGTPEIGRRRPHDGWRNQAAEREDGCRRRAQRRWPGLDNANSLYTVVPSARPKSGADTLKVQPGETLSGISRRTLRLHTGDRPAEQPAAKRPASRRSLADRADVRLLRRRLRRRPDRLRRAPAH